MTAGNNRLRAFLALLPALALLAGAHVGLHAQDRRTVQEPVFPSTCAVLRAPLGSTADGPRVQEDVDLQNIESGLETEQVQAALKQCQTGQALELALGADGRRNAFLLNPISVPAGVSLIVDGGVTVFASRDPRNFQNKTVSCGTYGPLNPYGVTIGCLPFLTLASDSGIYGDGVIDAQGNKELLYYPAFPPDVIAPPQPFLWWDLTSNKNHCVQNSPGTNCEQASPIVISAGNLPASESANVNLVLDKITIRNPPFHTVSLGGSEVTVWGVKVQAPWNIPNTDGFDIHASNVTVYDTTVSNGDQELAFGSNSETPSENITVDNFRGYSKGGVTILGGGFATSHLLATNILITGDLPKVQIKSTPGYTRVNGMTESEMQQRYGLKSYAQALPNATDLKGLQISDTSQQNKNNGSNISDVTFQSVCIADIVNPLDVDLTATDNAPTVKKLTFKDIHILAPTFQFPEVEGGIPDGNPGSYKLTFITKSTTTPNTFTLDNLVVDDQAPPSTVTSIGSIDAEANTISTKRNVYPSLLNELTAGTTRITQPGPPRLTLLSNSYRWQTQVNNPDLAHACGQAPIPFVVGNLFVSLGRRPETGARTNLTYATARAGSSITLNAVVQPIMSQTTLFRANAAGADPGLLAIGSPALSNPVLFYEGKKRVGFGFLSANGTLAMTVIRHISRGRHIYSALYPRDRYYGELWLRPVTVEAW